MIGIFAFLALLMDYGHSQFPDSTLNWWTWMFILLGGCAAVLQLQSLNEMRHYFVGRIPFSLVAPLVFDLLIAVVLTFGYSTLIS
jgi:hypothetical protein